MNHKAIIGLGFGDEGKGITTNFLCLHNPNTLVVRFSGGQQAGHTVVLDGKRHVFSNLGSGTLNHNPTYWSKYCTFDPVGFYNEVQILLKMGITPVIYIDNKCPVTTPMDKEINGEKDMKNGTCGVGVGTTQAREEKFFSLLFEDLFHPSVVATKIKLMREYYRDCDQEYIDVFFYCVNWIYKVFVNWGAPFYRTTGVPKGFEDIVFESSQGLLLDQHYGFFPHVTRSNVGSTNILEMGYDPEYWCVTRAYQTRHGNGPMTNLSIDHNLKLNPLETNVHNKFQGEFKVSLLDLDLLDYSVSKDPSISSKRKNLVITCVDQLEDTPRYTRNGEIVECKDKFEFIQSVGHILQFENIYYSESEESKNIQKFSVR
jgi:adenylosuccinate synthase